jgi:hypothetical protein
MKLSINAKLKMLFTFMSVCLFQAIAMAQDSTVHTTQTTQSSSETSFQVEPWMWIVGGVAVLLIIILLLRGQSSNNRTSSDRVTVTKTVERDTDV